MDERAAGPLDALYRVPGVVRVRPDPQATGGALVTMRLTPAAAQALLRSAQAPRAPALRVAANPR